MQKFCIGSFIRYRCWWLARTRKLSRYSLSPLAKMSVNQREFDEAIRVNLILMDEYARGRSDIWQTLAHWAIGSLVCQGPP